MDNWFEQLATALGWDKTQLRTELRLYYDLEKSIGVSNLRSKKTIDSWARQDHISLRGHSALFISKFVSHHKYHRESIDDAQLSKIVRFLNKKTGQIKRTKNNNSYKQIPTLLLNSISAYLHIDESMKNRYLYYSGFYTTIRRYAIGDMIYQELIYIGKYNEESYFLNYQGIIFKGCVYISPRALTGLFVGDHATENFGFRFIIVNLPADNHKEILSGLLCRLGDNTGYGVATEIVIESCRDMSAEEREKIMGILRERQYIRIESNELLKKYIETIDFSSRKAKKYKKLELNRPLIAKRPDEIINLYKSGKKNRSVP